jgi:hypothetical protein
VSISRKHGIFTSGDFPMSDPEHACYESHTLLNAAPSTRAHSRRSAAPIVSTRMGRSRAFRGRAATSPEIRVLQNHFVRTAPTSCHSAARCRQHGTVPSNVASRRGQLAFDVDSPGDTRALPGVCSGHGIRTMKWATRCADFLSVSVIHFLLSPGVGRTNQYAVRTYLYAACTKH